MAIKKIKLPDNTTEDINDPRLPAVTATDNGKILSVSGGIWSANSKPSYTLDEVSDGSTRKLSNYVTIAETETITGKKTFTGAIMSIKYDNPRIGFYTSADTLNGVIAYRDTVGPEIYTGSAWYRMYHAGNLTKSVLTGLLDADDGYYLPLTGGKISSSLQIFSPNTNPFGVYGGSNGAFLAFGKTTTAGSAGTRYGMITINAQDGELKRYKSDYSGAYTVYDSGNSNKSDVAWACSTLTATGNITPGANNTYTLGSDTRVWNVGYFRQALYFNRNNVIYFTATTAGGYFAWRVNGENSNRMTLNSTTLSMTGDITASGAITPGSDSRIKDNQKDINSAKAFSVIESLMPKTWVWNEKSGEKLNGKSAAGLVAQEVKEILPDAVTISENGGIKDFHSLNYNTIQGYEIAAIKGLIEEVKSLKAEIAELKKQIK